MTTVLIVDTRAEPEPARKPKRRTSLGWKRAHDGRTYTRIFRGSIFGSIQPVTKKDRKAFSKKNVVVPDGEDVYSWHVHRVPHDQNVDGFARNRREAMKKVRAHFPSAVLPLEQLALPGVNSRNGK